RAAAADRGRRRSARPSRRRAQPGAGPRRAGVDRRRALAAASAARGFVVLAVDAAQRVGDLTQGRLGAHGVENGRHQIARLAGGALEAGECRPGPRLGPGGPKGGKAGDLVGLHARIDLQNLRLGLVVLAIAVHAHHLALAGLDLALPAVGGLGDFALLEAALERAEGAALLLDPAQVAERLVVDL